MRHDKMAAWAGHEDEAILESVRRNGPRWSRVAEDIPGRSIASVRNRYLRIQRGVKMRSEGVAKNRCHACTRPLTPLTAPCHLPPFHGPNCATSHLRPPRAMAGGQLKLGHVCRAKIGKAAATTLASQIAGASAAPAAAPPALHPHAPAAGLAAMFSAIDALEGNAPAVPSGAVLKEEGAVPPTPPEIPAAWEERWNEHWKAKAKATAAPSLAQLAAAELPQLSSPSPAVHFAAITKEAEAVHCILGH